METNMETNQVETAEITTISHIIQRADGRCKGWAKKLNSRQILDLDLDKIQGANDLPGSYLKNGTDLELAPYEDFIFWGEENDHRKARGWTYRLYYPTTKKMGWVGADNRIKQMIKSEGHKDLMTGSGEIAGLVRIAKYISSGLDLTEKIARKTKVFEAIK
jgi:hypothetical protein